MKTPVATNSAKLLDVIALPADWPELRLSRGQVGTIVEILGEDVFEVEFCNPEGRTIALAELRGNDFLGLRHEPARSA